MAYNQKQPIATSAQRELMGKAYVVKKPKKAPEELIKARKDHHEAIVLCIQLSGLSNEYIAETLGIDKGNFSRMMSGAANFPNRKIDEIMKLCGNISPLQQLAWVMGVRVS